MGQNKHNLCSFLVEFWCEHGKATLKETNELVIGGGFTENIKAVRKHQERGMRAYSSLIQWLWRSWYKDATSCQACISNVQLYHHSVTRYRCSSPLSVHFESLDCQELWFKTGVHDKLRLVPIHEVCQKLFLWKRQKESVGHHVSKCNTPMSIEIAWQISPTEWTNKSGMWTIRMQYLCKREDS